MYGIPFGIGTPIKKVVQAWGNPAKTESIDSETTKYGYWDRDVELFVNKNQKVCGIKYVHVKPDSSGEIKAQIPARYQMVSFKKIQEMFKELYFYNGGVNILYHYYLG